MSQEPLNLPIDGVQEIELIERADVIHSHKEPSAVSPSSPDKSSFSKHFSKNEKDSKITLVWENINLHVLSKDPAKSRFLRPAYKNKHILKGVTGKAVSGELLAIMGPTGCGKTSLMNVLAARVSGLVNKDTKLTGSVKVNGVEREEEQFRRISAYVLQDDRLYPHLTVQETLMMAAHFFLPEEYDLERKTLLVDSVISELGLGKARNTIVGDEKIRGVSGGERKRANIAVQLISNPAILFLDEPTSGLDSFQAQAVMESMKAMTEHGRLVITVIHQPRSSIFEMFDKLLLLSEGRVVYMGDAGDAAEYFGKVGFPPPKFFNPADYFLDILSPDSRSTELESQSSKRILSLSDLWAANFDTSTLTSTQYSNEDINSLITTFSWSFARWTKNTQLLFWRSWTELLRNRIEISFKILMSCIFSGIMGGMYSGIGYDQGSIYNRMGLLFIICLNQSFNALGGVVNSFPKEKIIVNRERSSNAYDTVTYFFAKFCAEMPINLLPGFIFGCVVYWAAGLNPDRFGYFLLILLFTVVTAITLGLAVSAASPTPDFANAVGIPIMIITLIFGGWYINLDSLPPVAEWIPYVSFLRWAFQAFVINEFTGETFDCSGGSTSQCLENKDDILQNMSFDKQDLRQSILGLAVMFLFFLGCALFALERGRLVFLPLGHIGAKQRDRDDTDGNTNKNGYTMVATTDVKASNDGQDIVASEPEQVPTTADSKPATIENSETGCA